MHLWRSAITLLNFPKRAAKRAAFFSALLLSALMGLYGCHSKSDPDWIARVGNETITVSDFRMFYEFDPNFGMDSSGYGALHDALQKRIDYSLAYLLAEKEGVLDRFAFANARRWETRQAMLRQLYREKIRHPLKIDETDLREAYVEYHTELHVRHLFTRDEGQIRVWQDSLRAGVAFETLAQQAFRDSVLAARGGDLGWVKAGELDEEFASAAMQLQRGEISSPVRTRWGYHLIQLLDRKNPVLLTEEGFASQRQSLEKRVRRKREARAASRFISEYIGNINPQPVASTFRLLWETLTRDRAGEKLRPRFDFSLSDQTLTRARQKLEGQLHLPLIRHKEGEISLATYLDAVSRMPAGDRPRFQSPRQLSDHIGRWVRDELLLREARRLNLQQHPRVQKEVREFMNEQTYYYYLNRQIAALEVPDSVATYFRTPPGSRRVPRDFPQVRRFHTLQAWLWWRGERALHNQLRKLSVPVTIHPEKLQEENRTIDWQRRIPMFMLRKPS